MPYIMRNAEGRIIAVLSEEVEGSEFVAANDHELTSFLQNDSPEARAQQELLESDLGIIRILEDLIDILIERGAIMFSDFPEPAQRKLLARRGLRKEFAYMDDLFGGDENALPQTDAEEDGLF